MGYLGSVGRDQFADAKTKKVVDSGAGDRLRILIDYCNYEFLALRAKIDLNPSNLGLHIQFGTKLKRKAAASKFGGGGLSRD